MSSLSPSRLSLSELEVERRELRGALSSAIRVGNRQEALVLAHRYLRVIELVVAAGGAVPEELAA